LTLPIFEHSKVPLFLFIEEPDLFLHPGYQRVFINSVLFDKERELYVFVTTHSSQFLDITVSRDDCSVFRCEKQISEEQGPEHDPIFTVRNTTFGDQSLLKHIGVRPSSVMFANCTIWVEGITDRLYFSRFVELLLQQRGFTYTESLHYAFVEYGGGNITHWSFLDDEQIDVERICARLMLIVDQDTDKDERHKKLSEKLQDRFIRLPVREVENLLSPKVIKRIIGSYEQAKIELKDFEQADYSKVYLGKFIDDHVLIDKEKSKRYGKLKTCYQDKSGTVKGKVEFCRRALKQIESIDDLSDEAKNIAGRICDFIAHENS
jgi:predicted ATP-dependent endonuclease of OLD family